MQNNVTLMSATAFNSYITYTNDSFVDISGFTREELIGQPHNLVRHPNMPKQVFADASAISPIPWGLARAYGNSCSEIAGCSCRSAIPRCP
ncbi:PAS domain S-box protein [Dryocola boscaweniae]|uniref:PAS domain S-box protein n=1 Tax=Dryocola boscaweniae TaxID=2925397 RepID=UPI0022F08174|nr:PAS domain S-box protein [Dryocola boscaweniae]